MIETFLFILLILYAGILSYLVYVLNKKYKILITWVENFIIKILDVNKQIHEIDIGGAFEADDDVGVTFKAIRDMINELNELLEKEDVKTNK